MAKTKISEFSTTAGNNTDINSINIAEGCSPSGINDAIRELMRQLKEFQTGGAGDSVNSGGDFSVATNKFTVASASGNTAVAGTLGVTGTTTLTGALVANGNATLGDASGDTVTIKGTPTLEVNPTLSGGTANGVLYLNGSKVATSGSALTFDGTTFTIPKTTLSMTAGSTDSGATNSALYLNVGTPATTANLIRFAGAVSSDIYYGRVVNADAFGWGIVGGSELMRLTSTGLGIGTSSPSYKLDVNGVIATGSGSNRGFFYNDGSKILVESSSTYPIAFSINGGVKATLDSSGNLGLGVTPSASSACVNMELSGYGATLSARNTSSAPQFAMMSNGVGNWYAPTYKINGKAAMYLMQGNDGSHAWYTAGTGTAGNAISFTQAMTLDASGRLGIGTTSPSQTLNVNGIALFEGSVQGNVIIQKTGTNGFSLFSSAAGTLGFYDQNAGAERARIDSSGNFLVGTTTNIRSSKFVVGGALGGGTGVEFDNSDSNTWIPLAFHTAGTLVGYISATTSITTYNSVSDYRLKTVTGNVTGQGERIDALKPVDYLWKEGGQQARGFLAHEFQAIYPNSVTGTKDAVDADGNPVYQAMQASTAEVIADLVAEIKSLRARVASLESK